MWQDRKLQVFIYMFCKQLKCFLGVLAGAWVEGRCLLIICNKWYYDSNEAEIKISGDIWPSTRYSTISLKSLVSTAPQTLSHISNEAPTPCDFAVLTLQI